MSKLKPLSALISLGLSALLLNGCALFSPKNNKENYSFEVKIVSGFLQGKTYQGTFSYDPTPLKGDGKQVIEVEEIDFSFRDDRYERESFDAIPKVHLQDGSFKELQFVGGPRHKRFGLNAGFDRWQFGREEEAFIPEGGQYFGYLDADTYVEGAGTVKYRKQD